ncbi:MAG: DUF4252 domain-containing protein [Bacteroidales bacterium]|nr:DUF4252 domain-containing protein [Bacteroidales bacterium]
MKKFLVLFTLLALSISGFAAQKPGKAVPKDKLLSVISEYRHNEGFHVIKLGNLATSLVRSAAKVAVKVDGDQEAAEALKMINGVRKVCVVEYEECSGAVRDSFNSKLSRVLSDSELLMEVKDDEDQVFMYGIVDDDASAVRDFVIYVPEDSALICMFGSISMDALTKLIEMK